MSLVSYKEERKKIWFILLKISSHFLRTGTFSVHIMNVSGITWHYRRNVKENVRKEIFLNFTQQ